MKLAIVVSSPGATVPQIEEAYNAYVRVFPANPVSAVILGQGAASADAVYQWAAMAGMGVQTIPVYPDRYGPSWAAYVQAVETGRACDGLLVVQAGVRPSPADWPQRLRTLVDAMKPDALVYTHTFPSLVPVKDWIKAQGDVARTHGAIQSPTGRKLSIHGRSVAQNIPQAHSRNRDPLAVRVAALYQESQMCCPRLQPDLYGAGQSLPHGHRWQCPSCALWWMVVTEDSPETEIPPVRLWQVDRGHKSAADTGPRATGRGGVVQDLRQAGPEVWRQVTARHLGLRPDEVTQAQIDQAKANWFSLWHGAKS